MNSSESLIPNTSPDVENEAAANELSQLPPWDQVRILSRRQLRRCSPAATYPRLQLRGDKMYLRALRAAELTAWQGAGSQVNQTLPTECAGHN